MLGRGSTLAEYERMTKQFAFALLFAAGCVDGATDSTDTTDTAAQALEQPNGGFQMTDEAPLFDREADFAAIEKDAAFSDTLASDPAVAELDAQASVARHRVLIAWGRMPPDLDATTARNWSGTLAVSRGALVVGRTIGFEDATDAVLPRTSIDAVSFESVTKPFADGLLLRVLDPDPAQGAPHITYTSADASHTYDLDLSQLANGPLVVDAGDGFKVVAIALRDGDACDHGFMRGRWVALRPQLGVYRGVVANAAGDPIGHLRGIWGTRANGDKVMFGKLIGLDGHFRGILAGTYEAGHWRSHWLTRAGDVGVAGGLYFDAPNLPGGFFAGRWAETSCAQ